MPSSKTSRKQYNKSFQQTLAQLNEQQRKAVEQIEGPVLVIAGPGTGKTHILSARIGNILQETDTFAQNILCLTFTDAGVVAMRERLLQFIGPEAHRVHIYTFHSFCNSIIQENLELFGRHDLEPLSELERVEIIRRIIDDLPFDHPLKKGRADVYFYENHLFDLFRRMKSEDWSVDYVQQQIDSYLKDLPFREEFIYKRKSGRFKKGDLKEAQVELVRQKMLRLRSAATLFKRYEHYLHQYRRYDFDDMILWVLQAFENKPALLRNYQERYLYFLVDEYQDTNGAQNTILKKLINYWENPNVFIVGDDDQSIYEFQGARLRNITDFYDAFKEHIELVVLKDNYRSSQNILDSSHALIENNEKRLVKALNSLNLIKKLVAQNPTFAEIEVVPQLVNYKNRLQEATDIVAQIEQLSQDGFPLNEVAVLYAQHRQIQPIINLLEKKNIPYYSKRRVNILNETLIQNIRQLLAYINLEHRQALSGEHLIFQILHFDFLEIPTNDLMELSLWMAKNRFKEATSWRSLLGNTNKLNALNLQAPQKLLAFSNNIKEWVKNYSNLSLPVFFEQLINQGGIVKFLLQQEHPTWSVQVLNTFFDFIKKECDRKNRLKLNGFLEILQKMDANRLSLEINRAIFSKNGVQLVTAHSSKGLEFQKVFIIDAVKDFWEPRSRHHRQFSFPDTLTFSGEEDALEARRRLFYVAMTRAKEQLQISYSQVNADEKQLQQTQFIDELLEQTSLSVVEKELDAQSLLDAQILSLQSSTNFNINLAEKDRIDTLLENFVMSVSSLNRYIKCPLSFYYEYIIKVPTLMSPAAAYGTAMHYAFMKLFDKRNESKSKEFPSVEQFIPYFEKEMQRQELHFTTREYQHRMQKGKAILQDYYQQFVPLWQKNLSDNIVKTELEIRNVEIEGVPIKGVIDRIDVLNSNAAHIEDYKTGSIEAKKLYKPSKKNPLGGNYWRQLVFYKVLYESALPNQHRIKSGAIAYLEPDAKNVFSTKKIDLRIEDAIFMKKLIQETWQKIKAHEFQQGCGEKYCVWCNFAQQNNLPKSLVDTEIEELDDV